MIRIRITLHCIVFMVLVGATLTGCILHPPPVEEQELTAVRNSLQQAISVGAEELAPQEYAAAQTALTEAERQIAARNYDQARTALSIAEQQAATAIQQAANERKRRDLIATAPPQEETPPAEPAKPIELRPKPKPHAIASYIVSNGDTLWSIAARAEVYDDPLLWPLLYQANRDQIKDPRQVHNGQVLTIPRNHSDSDREEARAKARKSEVFPVK